MHDIKAIRDDVDAFTAGLKRRGLKNADDVAKQILAIDQSLRQSQTIAQQAQARRNVLSDKIRDANLRKDKDAVAELKALVQVEKERIQQAEEDEADGMAEISEILVTLPNIPAEDVPFGTSEEQNDEVVERCYGKAPGMNRPKDHVELGEMLGILDFTRAAQVSGARFVYLKGAGARLERALASFMLDIATQQFGYEEFVPPLLVRDAAMFGTGQLPKFKEELFATSKLLDATAHAIEVLQHMYFGYNPADSLLDEGNKEKFLQKYNEVLEIVPPTERFWLIPTAEVPLTNYVANFDDQARNYLQEDQLPLRFTAYTPCFRAEAGAAGKDTRGMIRMHQFSKVELVSITTPEESDDEHERMTNCAQEILKRLELHHRVMKLCTGDLGFSARKTYDIEVWLPGQNCFREISSCSNCGDFQARRMNARYRPKDAKQTRYVHTLNGSSLAIGRTIVAIMENYQQSDGSIAIPDALRPYMGGQERIAK
jgi:seryl-tRNA synthetase